MQRDKQQRMNQQKNKELQPFETLNLEQTFQNRGAEIESLYKLSEKLHAGLDKEIIAIVMELIEAGIDAESIAAGNCLMNH